MQHRTGKKLLANLVAANCTPVFGSRVKTLFVTQTSRNCNVASASVSYPWYFMVRNRGAGYVTITTCLGDKQCFHSRAEYRVQYKNTFYNNNTYSERDVFM